MLRDLTRRGPYMHNGAFKTLEEVVRYYDHGGSADPQKDPRLRPLNLSEQERGDLVAFLASLTGNVQPGRAPSAWRKRAKRTNLRFVGATGKPLKGLAVRFVPVGDEIPIARADGNETIEAVTNDQGWLTFTPPGRTHVRVVLPGGLEPLQGALVPDTCRRAKIKVPVRGRTRLLVTFLPSQKPPRFLAAEHQGGRVLQGHPTPRTRFALEKVATVKRRAVAQYEGWVRSDVPPSVHLRIPGDKHPRRIVTLAPDALLPVSLGK